MNEPPLHTALFKAENLLSSGGIIFQKYFLKMMQRKHNNTRMSGPTRTGRKTERVIVTTTSALIWLRNYVMDQGIARFNVNATNLSTASLKRI